MCTEVSVSVIVTLFYLTMCEERHVTSNYVKLNMNTSRITGTKSSCKCDISFHVMTYINISSQIISSPGCSTEMHLGDWSVPTRCINSSILSISYANNLTSDDQLFILARANGESQLPMSGTIHITTDKNKNFTLLCHGTTVTGSPSTQRVITSIVRTTRAKSITTTPLKTFPFGSRPSTASSIASSTASSVSLTTSLLLPTQSTTAGISYMTTTQSNETFIDPKNFPVALTAGCAAGGVVLVGLIIVAIIICRRKRKYPQGNSKKHDPTPIRKGDRRSMDDEYLSMENDLYCSSDVFPMPSENTTSDRTSVEPEGKHKPVVSPNIYTLVGKPPKSPNPKLNHRAAPSGDVYTVVEKFR